MARSHSIYILTDELNEVIGAFTVKHEMEAARERHKAPTKCRQWRDNQPYLPVRECLRSAGGDDDSKDTLDLDHASDSADTKQHRSDGVGGPTSPAGLEGPASDGQGIGDYVGGYDPGRGSGW